MNHLSDSIRRSGLPCEYSTNLYEHLHILLMKIPYRASNKKDFAKQMTRHHQRLLAIGRKTSTFTEVEVSHDRETALDKVRFKVYAKCMLNFNCASEGFHKAKMN